MNTTDPSSLAASQNGISAGSSHSCAVASGKVYCWGSNSKGQLGNGTTTDSASPVEVSGITTAKAVAAGYDHSCALLSDGTIECWGDNSAGHLGNGSTTDSANPVTVQVSGVQALGGGEYNGAALTASGQVVTWGGGANGRRCR